MKNRNEKYWLISKACLGRKQGFSCSKVCLWSNYLQLLGFFKPFGMKLWRLTLHIHLTGRKYNIDFFFRYYTIVGSIETLVYHHYKTTQKFSTFLQHRGKHENLTKFSTQRAINSFVWLFPFFLIFTPVMYA